MMNRMSPALPLLALGIALASASSAVAATCTVPNAISNGQVADASKVMGNFTAVANCAQQGVTTTGTPVAGSIPVFSGPQTITGANLSGDITTSGGTATTLSNSGVNAGFYVNPSITVDSKGRVTAASSGTGGSGGSGGPQFSVNLWGGGSSSGHAAKGSIVIPTINMLIYGCFGSVDEISGAKYMWGVYVVDNTNAITAVAGTTPVYTAAATATTSTYMKFSAPVALSAGQRYAVLHIRTDATGSTPSGVHAGSSDVLGPPVVQTATYVTYDSVAPAAGATTTSSGGNPYAIGYSWQSAS